MFYVLQFRKTHANAQNSCTIEETRKSQRPSGAIHKSPNTDANHKAQRLSEHRILGRLKFVPSGTRYLTSQPFSEQNQCHWHWSEVLCGCFCKVLVCCQRFRTLKKKQHLRYNKVWIKKTRYEDEWTEDMVDNDEMMVTDETEESLCFSTIVTRNPFCSACYWQHTKPPWQNVVKCLTLWGLSSSNLSSEMPSKFEEGTVPSWPAGGSIVWVDVWGDMSCWGKKIQWVFIDTTLQQTPHMGLFAVFIFSVKTFTHLFVSFHVHLADWNDADVVCNCLSPWNSSVSQVCGYLHVYGCGIELMNFIQLDPLKQTR